MNGKSKCKILKQIRREIAKQNDIEYVTSECKFQGECTGTCPKCESEVRYLEQELSKRKAAGKTVAVVGIAATLLSGCGSHRPVETTPPTQTEEVVAQTETADPSEFDGVPPTEELVEMGEVPYEYTEEPLMGDPVETVENTQEDQVMGNMDTVPDEGLLDKVLDCLEDLW